MRNIKLVIQYDGSEYAGFQVQGDTPTIQRELEAALARVLAHPVRIRAAGRTDAGVHAVGQVITACTGSPIAVAGLVNALNNTLPPAICVAGGEEVAPQFHPRYDAVAKLYSYRILNRREPSPFIGRYAWHIARPLDLGAMEVAAGVLRGRHDFSAFEAAGSCVRDKVRTLERLDCERHAEIVEIRALGDGFLYRMMRNIVGTLVEVGRGRLAPQVVGPILESGERGRAGPTAPPHGLCLVRVDY